MSDTEDNNAPWGDGYNPYQQPQADLAVTPKAAGLSLVAPQRLSAAEGFYWLSVGWRYFKMNPWIWLAMGMVFWGGLIISSMIPLLNFISGLLMPVFTAGFMLASHKLYQGEKFGIGEVFAGFNTRFGPLLGLGALYFLGTIVLAGITVGVVLTLAGGMKEAETLAQVYPFLPPLLALLLLLIMVPLMMAYWFAPALIVMHGVPVFQALGLSFRGCWLNMWPLLVYGFVMFILSVVASLPFMLGWLLLTPIGFASLFTGYRRIFTEAADQE